jgi:hypothetical protein
VLHAHLLGGVAVLVAPATTTDEHITGVLLSIKVPAGEGRRARPSDSLGRAVFFIVEDIAGEVIRILTSENTWNRRICSFPAGAQIIDSILCEASTFLKTRLLAQVIIVISFTAAIHKWMAGPDGGIVPLLQEIIS